MPLSMSYHSYFPLICYSALRVVLKRSHHFHNVLRDPIPLHYYTQAFSGDKVKTFLKSVKSATGLPATHWWAWWFCAGWKPGLLFLCPSCCLFLTSVYLLLLSGCRHLFQRKWFRLLEVALYLVLSSLSLPVQYCHFCKESLHSSCHGVFWVDQWPGWPVVILPALAPVHHWFSPMSRPQLPLDIVNSLCFWFL